MPPKSVSVAQVRDGKIIVRKDEIIQLNCISARSKPRALIAWKFAGRDRKASSEVSSTGEHYLFHFFIFYPVQILNKVQISFAGCASYINFVKNIVSTICHQQPRLG